MRPVELADGNLMCDRLPKALSWKPGMDVKRSWFHPKLWFAKLCEVQIDGVVRRRTNRHGNAGEGGRRGPMNMPARDQLRPPMTPNNSCRLVSMGAVVESIFRGKAVGYDDSIIVDVISLSSCFGPLVGPTRPARLIWYAWRGCFKMRTS